MKLKNKMLCLFATIIMSSFFVVGCTEQEKVTRDESLDKLSVNADNVSLSDLMQTIPVEGESFSLSISYSTGAYDLSRWRITDSKYIAMAVKTENLPDGYEVYVEHVHADISIKATTAQVDGIIQDTMDDTYHGTSQDGFYISNDNTYYNIFAIEGFNQTMFEMWGYVCGEYGNIKGSTRRLSEENLVKYGGAYAQKIQIVYDLIVKSPGDEKFRSISTISEFLIPLNKES